MGKGKVDEYTMVIFKILFLKFLFFEKFTKEPIN